MVSQNTYTVTVAYHDHIIVLQFYAVKKRLKVYQTFKVTVIHSALSSNKKGVKLYKLNVSELKCTLKQFILIWAKLCTKCLTMN